MERIHQYVIQKADHGDLQKELAMLSVWMIKWQMEFNVDKRKVMHKGEKWSLLQV